MKENSFWIEAIDVVVVPVVVVVGGIVLVFVAFSRISSATERASHLLTSSAKSGLCSSPCSSIVRLVAPNLHQHIFHFGKKEFPTLCQILVYPRNFLSYPFPFGVFAFSPFQLLSQFVFAWSIYDLHVSKGTILWSIFIHLVSTRSYLYSTFYIPKKKWIPTSCWLELELKANWGEPLQWFCSLCGTLRRLLSLFKARYRKVQRRCRYQDDNNDGNYY